MKTKSLAEVVELLMKEGLQRGTIEFADEVDRRFIEDQGRFYERPESVDHFHDGKKDLMTTSDVVA